MSATTGCAEPFRVVIPARCDSTRLPGKPLRVIGGVPLIRRVHDNARAAGAERVIVATDDEAIAKCIRDVGGEAQMTSPECASGSDRVAEAVTALRWPDEIIVVNLQGDEPFLAPADVRGVADTLTRSPEASMATLAAPLTPEDENDSNVVKVISDDRGTALDFSRVMPQGKGRPRRHVGIYAYRCGYLKRFTRLAPPEIERRERLEQLRALSRDDRIVVGEAESEVVLGIDTEEDLRKAERLLEIREDLG